MGETLKNLCAHIPVDLHNKVREKQMESGQSLGEYMTKLIAEYYAIKENEGGAIMSETRTLAVQVSAELFDRLDAYLTAHRMKKKEFVTSAIIKALDEAEAALAGNGAAENAEVSHVEEDAAIS